MSRSYPTLPVSSESLPWARPFGRRCQARLAEADYGTYYGRCDLRPHDASMGHALERGMEVIRWAAEVSTESPDRVTWRGLPEPFEPLRVSPTIVVRPDPVRDDWRTRRRFVRTYLSLRRIADLHIAAGHHAEFTAVNESHIGLRCYTCTPQHPAPPISTESPIGRG